MGLSDDERRKFEEEFRREAAEEHQRRAEILKGQPQQDPARFAEVIQLRAAVRDKFWSERGYVKYTDSRGAVSWITPDDYAARMAHRRARQQPWVVEFFGTGRGKNLLFGLLMLSLAVGVGLLLTAL